MHLFNDENEINRLTNKKVLNKVLLKVSVQYSFTSYNKSDAIKGLNSFYFVLKRREIEAFARERIMCEKCM